MYRTAFGDLVALCSSRAMSPGVGSVLASGKKLKAAVKKQKADTSSQSSKPDTPKIPLETLVGCGQLTLGELMKQDKLSYHDAVMVYLAFKDSQETPSPADKKLAKGPLPKSAKVQKAAAARAAKQSKPGKAGKAWVEEEVDEMSNGGGNQKPKGILRKNAHEALSEVSGVSTTTTELETPGPPRSVSFRISNKRPPQPPAIGDAPSCKRRATATANPVHEDESAGENQAGSWACDEQDDGWWDEDNLWLEYDLWRKGLPQLSEMNLAAVKSKPAKAPQEPPQESQEPPQEPQQPPQESPQPILGKVKEQDNRSDVSFGCMIFTTIHPICIQQKYHLFLFLQVGQHLSGGAGLDSSASSDGRACAIPLFGIQQQPE